MNDVTDSNQLLKSEDEDFISNAYTLLFDRHPDNEGMAFYLGRLRAGESKLQLLSELLTSDEYREVGKQNPALTRLVALRRIVEIPVIGALVASVLGFRTLPVLRATRIRLSLQRQVSALASQLATMTRTHTAFETSGLPMQLHRLSLLESKAIDVQAEVRFVRDQQAAFQHGQFPTLLQAIADFNRRQLAIENDNTNLVLSVPVSLRKITRDIQLASSRLETTADMQRAMERDLLLVKQRVESAEEKIARALAQWGAQLPQSTSALFQTQEGLGGTLLAHEKKLTELPASLERAFADIRYLLGRTEFVRRELMYEMRYGVADSKDKSDKLKADPTIISVKKLADARQTCLRVNLGCGHLPIDGYLNVDRRALPDVDVVAEVDNLPFAPREIDEIYSAHLIEHFPEEQVRRSLLAYWFSLLKPGGRFRAVVPDAAAMMKDFVRGVSPFERVRLVTFGGQDYEGDFHYNMYTPESLGKLLTDAGFVEISLIAEDRVNGDCKEFEIMARRAAE